MGDILVVDDEKDIRSLLADVLCEEGYNVRTAATSQECLQECDIRMPMLVVLDIWLRNSNMDGLQILTELHKRHPDLLVIIISGHGTEEMAIKALKMGAFAFLEKPIRLDYFLITVKRALEDSHIRREYRHLQKIPLTTEGIVGCSSAAQNLRQVVERVSAVNSRIFIHGHAGVGKETIARLIHMRSNRANMPFITIKTSGMSESDLLYECFGGQMQQDNGQARNIVGAFERAHGGTVCIDEITNLPASVQSVLLKFLAEGHFTRIHSTNVVKPDVRLISLSSHAPSLIMEENLVRMDLYNRLSVVTIPILSLAERREDIVPLVEYFARALAELHGYPIPQISEQVMAALRSYNWPRNMRQLRNVIEDLLTRCAHERRPIKMDDLPSEIIETTPEILRKDERDLLNMNLKQARDAFEREYLQVQLARFNGNVSKTAGFIGMERSALHRKMKGLGLMGTNVRIAD